MKTWQRSATGQKRLNSLDRLCIENALASIINFDDIINEFTVLKAHTKLLISI